MSALDVQIGGEHYKSAKIQPVQYIEANGLGFLEGCVVKRVTRHNKPTGKGRQDIEKAIHELQLLLELRYAPVEAQVAPALSMPPPCPECGCGPPTDMPGMHYATCSKLTAPKEFVEQVEATFDELEADPDRACPHCGSREGAFHHADCHLMRKGKSHLAKHPALTMPTPAELQGAAAEVIAIDENVPVPPAVCPGCGREEGTKCRRGCPTHRTQPDAVEDPWAGAPEWAKYKAQDADGDWFFYDRKPEKHADQWNRQAKVNGQCTFTASGEPNPNWRDTLIARP